MWESKIFWHVYCLLFTVIETVLTFTLLKTNISKRRNPNQQMASTPVKKWTVVDFKPIKSNSGLLDIKASLLCLKHNIWHPSLTRKKQAFGTWSPPKQTGSSGETYVGPNFDRRKNIPKLHIKFDVRNSSTWKVLKYVEPWCSYSPESNSHWVKLLLIPCVAGNHGVFFTHC